MTKIKIVSPDNPDGIIRDMTPEEQSQYDSDTARMAQEQADKEAEAETKANLKASAKAKLVAGEPLTEEEADTLVV
jgi:hypothetical protein